jgi:hypothetical protein
MRGPMLLRQSRLYISALASVDSLVLGRLVMMKKPRWEVARLLRRMTTRTIRIYYML